MKSFKSQLTDGPGEPLTPEGPGSPSIPGKPCGPGSPLGPVKPWGPCGPGYPVVPGNPTRPIRPYTKRKVWDRAKTAKAATEGKIHLCSTHPFSRSARFSYPSFFTVLTNRSFFTRGSVLES